jgi:hypothetical protein
MGGVHSHRVEEWLHTMRIVYAAPGRRTTYGSRTFLRSTGLLCSIHTCSYIGLVFRFMTSISFNCIQVVMKQRVKLYVCQVFRVLPDSTLQLS